MRKYFTYTQNTTPIFTANTSYCNYTLFNSSFSIHTGKTNAQITKFTNQLNSFLKKNPPEALEYDLNNFHLPPNSQQALLSSITNCEQNFLSPTYTVQQLWKKSIQEEGGENFEDLNFIDDTIYDTIEEMDDKEFLSFQNSIFNNKTTENLLALPAPNMEINIKKHKEINIEESEEDEEDDNLFELVEETCWVELKYDENLNIWC